MFPPPYYVKHACILTHSTVSFVELLSSFSRHLVRVVQETPTATAEYLRTTARATTARSPDVMLIVGSEEKASSKRNKSTVGLFLSEFQDFLQHHVVKSQNTLILGDFNFHYEDQLNTDASRFRDILSNHSLCQHVSGPTHMDGHTLDLIINKLTDNLVSKTTVSDLLTDHGAVHCDLHLPTPQPLRQSVQYRNYAALDKDMLRVDI